MTYIVRCYDCHMPPFQTDNVRDAERRWRDHHAGTRHTVGLLGHEVCWVDDSLCPDCGLTVGE